MELVLLDSLDRQHILNETFPGLSRPLFMNWSDILETNQKPTHLLCILEKSLCVGQAELLICVMPIEKED